MEQWEVAIRESVRHTISSCVVAADRRRLAELAACFTEGGSMQIGDEEPLVGRVAILESLGRRLPSARVPTHAHHHVTSTHFESVTPEAVDAWSYFTVMTDYGPDHWGRYRDRFVAAEGRWLLESRRITVDGFAAESYFRPASDL
jgi:hypothetical protein